MTQRSSFVIDPEAFRAYMEDFWRRAGAEIQADANARAMAAWITASTWNARAAGYSFIVDAIQQQCERDGSPCSKATARGHLADALGMSDRNLARQMGEMSYAAAEFRARLDDDLGSSGSD